MMSAVNDVVSVPTINGAAPKTSPTGFHSFEVTKDQPAAARVGSDKSHSMMPTPAIKPRIVREERMTTTLNGTSPCCNARATNDEPGRPGL